MLLVLAVCFLAYSNGANDNFKGVASLVGSRTTGYNTAIAWATVTTFAGSLAAIVLAQSLLERFSGKGLVPDALAGSESFLLSVAIGAGATVILATLAGFPISTTHVISGSVMGAGATQKFSAVRWGIAGNILAAWLFTIPAAALVAAGLYWPVEWIF